MVIILVRLFDDLSNLTRNGLDLVYSTSAVLHLVVVVGVFGRGPLLVPTGAARFGSVALRMEKLHMSVSSTDIKAPELSNSPQ